MNFILKDFQNDAKNKMLEFMDLKKKELVLRSPTGSGKTIILTSFIDDFCKQNQGFCFVWFTPGKGNLEEQSKAKMDKYVQNHKTGLIYDILLNGFQEGYTYFINWELVTKKGNNAIADGERDNLQDKVKKAHLEGLKFAIIVDEEHLNQTYKASDIIKLFEPLKVIRASATPQKFGDASLIDIKDETVISEGLIKKMIYINEGLKDGLDVENQIEYLIDLALKKQVALKQEYAKINKKINPLVIIQMPNKSNDLLQDVEEYLMKNEITYENKQLAIWLSEKKENVENIEELNAEPRVLIMKQAIATGWDCTRAHILVKLRDKMGDTFEIQTIGRIRRMPEAEHYDNPLLDVCYLYTIDDKFKEGVKQTFGANASEVKRLLLKKEHRDFRLVKFYNPSVKAPLDPKAVLECIAFCFADKYSLTNKSFAKNKSSLEAHGYNFNEKICSEFIQGKVVGMTKEEIDKQNKNTLFETLDTHKHGRDFQKALHSIGSTASLSYDNARIVMFRLFDVATPYKSKFLDLNYKQLYAFTINNVELLINDFRESITNPKYHKSIQITMQNNFNQGEFMIPREEIVGFNPDVRHCKVYESNVYEDYPSNVVGRSGPEIKFEKWCDKNTNWFYKNGESNIQYFSILYKDNFGKQRQFYPDYILEDKNKNIWIIETKGGSSMSGESEDRDKFSPFKFEALKQYGKDYSVNIGFVRFDEQIDELLINRTDYTESLKTEEWELLSDVID